MCLRPVSHQRRCRRGTNRAPLLLRLRHLATSLSVELVYRCARSLGAARLAVFLLDDEVIEEGHMQNGQSVGHEQGRVLRGDLSIHSYWAAIRLQSCIHACCW